MENYMDAHVFSSSCQALRTARVYRRTMDLCSWDCSLQMTQPTDICPYCRQSYTDWDDHKANCYELKRSRYISYPGMKQREEKNDGSTGKDQECDKRN
jgi:predicted amidophosphoribosyltransferase